MQYLRCWALNAGLRLHAQTMRSKPLKNMDYLRAAGLLLSVLQGATLGAEVVLTLYPDFELIY